MLASTKNVASAEVTLKHPMSAEVLEGEALPVLANGIVHLEDKIATPDAVNVIVGITKCCGCKKVERPSSNL